MWISQITYTNSIHFTESQTRVKWGSQGESREDDSLARVIRLIKYRGKESSTGLLLNDSEKESSTTPLKESGVVSFRTSAGLPFKSHHDSGLVFVSLVLTEILIHCIEEASKCQSYS